MKKAMIAVLASLCMGFVGLVLGVLLDETFGGSNFVFAPVLVVVFVVLTMGGFVIYFNDNK